MEDSNVTTEEPLADSIDESEEDKDDFNERPKDEEKPKRLSKTEKKFNRYQRKLASYKLKKLEKKKLKQLKEPSTIDVTSESGISADLAVSISANRLTGNASYDNYLNKRDLKKKSIERLNDVLRNNGSNCLKICIDCSFSDLMSDKELSRLAQQLGRCYASNKSLTQPVHLTLANLKPESKFYKECCRVNDGFAKYILNSTDKSIEEYYSDNLPSIAYLSPDSTTYLESLESDKTYVIGGLVDETVAKKVTINKCSQLSLNSYSLPIEKYMTRKAFVKGEIDPKTYNYNKILAINQVFDILANFFISSDWKKSLEIGVPKRKGFIVEKSNLNQDNSTTEGSS